MFDLPVARAMFQYICSTSDSGGSSHHTHEQVSEMAAAFAAQKRQRASRVTEEQRQAMYMQLAADMDRLPHIFLRNMDCKRLALVTDYQAAC